MWIEFGEIDYKIIIPLIYPFLHHLRIYIHEDDKKPIFFLFTNFCGYLLGGIIVLIIKCRLKNYSNKLTTDKIINENSLNEFLEQELTEINKSPVNIQVPTFKIRENQLNLNKKKLKNKNKRYQYLYILLLDLIYLIPMILDALTSLDTSAFQFGTSSSISLFFFILFCILSVRIILGTKIYYHQIFSSIIIGINIIIVIIFYLFKIGLSEQTFINIIIIMIITLFFALFNAFEKRYYNKYMDSPYHLMFVIGLYGVILLLLYEAFTILIFGFDRDFNGIFYQIYENFQKHEYLYILIFLGDILSAFILLSGITLTIYFLTPSHFIISESISQIITTFILSSKDYLLTFPVGIIILICFLFFFILLATLIYNEIIIINVCKLNKYTKKYINLRQLTDSQDMLIIDDVSEENK